MMNFYFKKLFLTPNVGIEDEKRYEFDLESINMTRNSNWVKRKRHKFGKTHARNEDRFSKDLSFGQVNFSRFGCLQKLAF